MGAALTKLLFQPPGRRQWEYDSRCTYLRLKTARGETIGAFYHDVGSSRTVIFSHGNGEDIYCCRKWICDLCRSLGVNVLAYDYTGYGVNRSEPSEEACYADIDAAFAFLTEKGVAPSNIVLWGRSLGSGPTCYLAEKQSKKGKLWSRRENIGG